MKRLFWFTLMLAVLLSLTSPLAAQEESPPQVGLRPDAPTYALHGPYWVGTQEFVIEDEERPLPVTVWYPALNPDKSEESIIYSVNLRWLPAPDVTATVASHALSGADPDPSGAPYPLVVFSPGFSMYAAAYADITEHLASYGFVVIAPEHAEAFYFEGDPWKDQPMSTIERPRDISKVIDYAESLTAAGGDLDRLIDMGLVAVAGHSYGGYTTLAAAGARYDPVGFHRRCEADRAAEGANVWLCDSLVPYEADMAAMAGFDPIPEDMWPSWGDPRVDAIIPMAGDSYMFDQHGLAEITVPVLAMGGTLDTSTPYEWGTHPTYEYVSSQQKALVAFDNAEHGIFIAGCQASPWMVDMGLFGFCADAIWDKNRAHDLINHFTTAFLLDVLKGDEDAHAALAPDAVTFPGIEYQAQGF